MSYTIEYSPLFKRSFKRCLKRGLDPSQFQIVLDILAEKGTLPVQYHPHKLSGKYLGLWECHIKADWLLIWEQNDDILNLILINTGTHSDLFDK